MSSAPTVHIYIIPFTLEANFIDWLLIIITFFYVRHLAMNVALENIFYNGNIQPLWCPKIRWPFYTAGMAFYHRHVCPSSILQYVLHKWKATEKIIWRAISQIICLFSFRYRVIYIQCLPLSYVMVGKGSEKFFRRACTSHLEGHKFASKLSQILWGFWRKLC